MQMRLMTIEECKYVYETYLVKDFPKDEVKPYAIIASLMEQGLYQPYGFYENEVLKAYAWLCHTKDGDMVLLDYLAVCSKNRGQGYGSRCLQLLQESDVCKQGLIIESEDIAYAKDEKQKAVRERRIHFYLKNGLWQTELHTCIYGVNYTILFLGNTKNNQQIQQELQQIYHVLLTDDKYIKHTQWR